jgi:hypothetical protein
VVLDSIDVLLALCLAAAAGPRELGGGGDVTCWQWLWD